MFAARVDALEWQGSTQATIQSFTLALRTLMTGQMLTHLEQLIGEYYDWLGFMVKRNIKVGKRARGGWDMELDIVGYDPTMGRLLHVEASLDADSWATREQRYLKKFGFGEKYILSEVFTWLPPGTEIERVAILPKTAGRTKLAGAQLRSIDDFMAEVKVRICAGKVMSKEAIPEQYPLLRTLQMALVGYHRALL